nr:NDP-sugar synthase [Candidatus Njordarchaeum guaymaensis]
MQAVVLAAGTGTRLMPLTAVIPKALLPIANRPLLDYVISSLKQASIREVIIVTGHLGSKITKYLQASKQYNNVEIDSIRAPKYDAGPLYSLLASEKLVNDDFLLAPVDLMLKHQIISKLLQSHTQRGTVNIAISELSSQGHQGTRVAYYKGLRSNGGPVLQFLEPEMIREKNRNSVKTILGSAIGVIICPREVFKYGHIAARNGSSRVIDALNRYIADRGEGRYMKVSSKDYWFDVDTIQTLLEANSFILKNSMVDEETGRFFAANTESQFENKPRSDYDSFSARVLGPSIIGRGCVIGEESRIGPYVSIQDNCMIGRHVACRNAIVLSRSRVGDNSTIENAVVSGQETITATKLSHEIPSSSR